MDVPAIRTERLDLVAYSPPLLEAVLEERRADVASLLGAAPPEGWPEPGTARFLRLRLAQLHRRPHDAAWLGRFLVVRGDAPALAGHAGFHGPPGTNALDAPDAVELGYALFPPFRRLGLATEAVAALIAWAREEQGVHRFLASIAPGNTPSLALVRRLGFVEIGEHQDEEDGLELEFELRLPALP